jgi:hypothetical protein
VKPEVNCGHPTKFKHIRPKNFKEEFFRKREHALENNILVAKILNAKVITVMVNIIHSSQTIKFFPRLPRTYKMKNLSSSNAALRARSRVEYQRALIYLEWVGHLKA